MNKIILEDRFTNHQKTMFIVYIGAPFIVGTLKLLQSEVTSQTYLFISILTVLYLLLITIAFLKRGFIEHNSELYTGSFFRGKLYFKKKIDISKRTGLCILKFKSSRKYAWFSDAKPDLANTFYRHEVNLLNETHTRRNPIMSLMEKSNAEKAIEFLTSNFQLEKQKYNPRFRYSRKR